MTQGSYSAAKSAQNRAARRWLLGACAGVFSVILSAAAFSQQGNLVAPTPAVSLQQAVSIATERRPGRVVRAVTVDSGAGRKVHEVRILLNEGGRVVTVRVDAQTGRVR